MNTIPPSFAAMSLSGQRPRLHSYDDFSPYVQISTFEYERLQTSSREYSALTKALLEAGTPYESLRLLINSTITNDKDAHSRTASSSNQTNMGFDFSSNDQSPASSSYHSLNSSTSTLSKVESDQKSIPIPDQRSTAGFVSSNQHQSLNLQNPTFVPQPSRDFTSSWDPDHRTLIFSKLSPNTSLQSLTDAIRGGSILNIRRRPKAVGEMLVSFVDAEAAQSFFKHVQKHDLYIGQKRAEVTSHDQPYRIGDVVSRGISDHKASRNLVLRGMSESQNHRQSVSREEEQLCAHLSHISDLEVVSVTTIDDDIFVSLNGIRQAIHARHCISHTGRYKGIRVEHWPDECDGPLSTSAHQRHLQTPQSQLHGFSATCINRFEPLFDSDSESSCE